MNKLLIVTLIVISLVAKVSVSFAESTPAVSNQSKVITLLHKEVKRSEVRELKLKGTQYVQLLDMQEQYQQELETIKTAMMGNAPMLEIRKQELDKRYSEELAKLLDAEQISSFLKNPAIATSK